MIQSAEFLSIELQGKILVELKTNLARFYLLSWLVKANLLKSYLNLLLLFFWD